MVKMRKPKEEQYQKSTAKKKKKKKGKAKIEKVMHEFKEGELHSGSKKGPEVTNPKQAIAIALSESRRVKRKKKKKSKRGSDGY